MNKEETIALSEMINKKATETTAWLMGLLDVPVNDINDLNNTTITLIVLLLRKLMAKDVLSLTDVIGDIELVKNNILHPMPNN